MVSKHKQVSLSWLSFFLKKNLYLTTLSLIAIKLLDPTILHRCFYEFEFIFEIVMQLEKNFYYIWKTPCLFIKEFVLIVGCGEILKTMMPFTKILIPLESLQWVKGVPSLLNNV
jgi:hypothetical protein